ncbi:hypothetical protein [Cyanobium sp. Morenito 9A2]|uniref:hypothetical protein n=1 Tax=Cyanobium sp. Morenito 9A2 TaxID=2823718 RepID=UPI0020CBC8DD|nr:hypothetical protein [Cyanobium sp. Morenito 9A2]MCP9848623.1 hypothetical protein [Cyanobium sp. Morenito 9A2]
MERHRSDPAAQADDERADWASSRGTLRAQAGLGEPHRHLPADPRFPQASRSFRPALERGAVGFGCRRW